MYYVRSLSLVFTFLFFAALFISCSDDNPVTPQEEHFEAVGMIIYDGQDKLMDYFGPDYTLEDEFAADTIYITTSKSNHHVEVPSL